MSNPRVIAWIAALVMLAGLYLRVDTVIHTIVDTPMRADAGEYFNSAYHLRHSGVYSHQPITSSPEAPPLVPDALRSPGYPLFLLPFAGGLPSDATLVLIGLTQAVLGSLLILLTFLLARRFVPAPVALLPAMAACLSPQLVIMPTYVLSESLFCTLFAGTLLCLLKAREAVVPGRWILFAGLLLGASALTRPTVNYLWAPLALLVYCYWPQPQRRQAALGFVAGVAALTVPWMIRNLVSTGALSDPTLSTLSIVIGHYPDMMFEHRPETLGYPYRFDPLMETLSASPRAAIAGILARASEAPWEYLSWYLLGKPVAFFAWADPAASDGIFTYPVFTSPYFSIPFYTTTLSVMRAAHPVWVLAGVGTALAAGLVAWRHRRLPALPWALSLTVLAYFVLIHLVAFPIARYSQPLLPMLFILTTAGLHRGIAVLRARSGPLS